MQIISWTDLCHQPQDFTVLDGARITKRHFDPLFVVSANVRIKFFDDTLGAGDGPACAEAKIPPEGQQNDRAAISGKGAKGCADGPQGVFYDRVPESAINLFRTGRCQQCGYGLELAVILRKSAEAFNDCSRARSYRIGLEERQRDADQGVQCGGQLQIRPGVGLAEFGDLCSSFVGGFPDCQGDVFVLKAGPDGVCPDLLESVFKQLQIFNHAAGMYEGGIQAAEINRVVGCFGDDVPGCRHAADKTGSFEYQNIAPRPGQVVGGGQPIVACANDNNIGLRGNVLLTGCVSHRNFASFFIVWRKKAKQCR